LYIQIPEDPKSPYKFEPDANIDSGLAGVTWLQELPSHFQIPAPEKAPYKVEPETVIFCGLLGVA
jgi:hypothetical protein